MTCIYCRGELESGTTTHVVTSDDCVIVVKNVPCLVCNQCGEAYFDDTVTEQLEKIVNNLKNYVTEIAVVSYADSAA